MATILLIDGHQERRATLAGLLAPAGHRVLQAAGPDQAMALSAEAPDVVVVDVAGEGFDGRVLVERLRRCPVLDGATYVAVGALPLAVLASSGCDGVIAAPSVAAA